MFDIILSFPNFNIYSTPLLIFVLQGYFFAVLLLLKYKKDKLVANIFLALILIITCYHRTTYMIGFMGWYDTFKNTKINYFLIPLSLALGPLIYFYIKLLTTPHFKFNKKHLWHFAPLFIFIVYRIVLYLHDVTQAGFNETQNGVWFTDVHRYVGPFVDIFGYCQQLVYYAFSIQLFYNYRQKIKAYFSNTYKLELNWLRNFLFLYCALFVYSLLQLVFENSIFELSYTQRWWYDFAAALVVLYVSIKGYMTDLNELKSCTDQLELTPQLKQKTTKQIDKINISNEDKSRLEAFMINEKPYLNPELNLTDLAKQFNTSAAQLSEIINNGFDKNFNDFINSYRVQAVQDMLKEGKHKKLSFLGIAYECGFNSKATFNRVFKKIAGTSPTEFLKNNTNS